MQDLEIKGTGNSRFLKSSVPATTTWEDFLTMLRAGNLPIDLTGLNSAGIITQNPSAYNKANVLPDDVCSALGINPQTSEPKDAFLAAALQVGDTLTTTRTDLGDNWLLCNGDTVETSDYPNLKEVMPTTVDGPWTAIENLKETYPNFPTVIMEVRVLNGYIFVVGYRPMGNSQIACVACSTSLSGQWTVVDLYNANGISDINGDYRLREMVYANGYYMFLGYGRSAAETSGSYTHQLVYTNNPLGEWQRRTISTDIPDIGRNSQTTSNISYCNGYYVISVYSTSNYALVYSDSLDGTFTVQIIYRGSTSFDTDADVMYPVVYLGGYYVVHCTNGMVFYSQDISATYNWASYNMEIGYNGKDRQYFLFGGVSGNKIIYFLTRNSSSNAYLYVDIIGISAEGDPTSRSRTEIANTTSLDGSAGRYFEIRPRWFGIVNDLLVVCGGMEYMQGNFSCGFICYATSVNGAWNDVLMDNLTEDVRSVQYIGSKWLRSNGELDWAEAIDGDWVGVPEEYLPMAGFVASLDQEKLFTVSDGPNIYYQDDSKITLPEISLSDKTYTYIKAG